MTEIATIRFQRCGKLYDFDAGELELQKGDIVIIESEFGLGMGFVAGKRQEESPPQRPLKPVLRKAQEEDFNRMKDNESLKTEAWDFCRERIMARGLPMKLVSTDVTLDRKKVIFYFVSETRVDFRELVKDLAAKFKTRIELRQIGVRDEAKTIGGFGVCGKEMCCRAFLTYFAPISIKMAKRQELSLNPSKLSGACGRLMCCLGFEYDDPADWPEEEVEEEEAGTPPEPIAVESVPRERPVGAQPAAPVEKAPAIESVAPNAGGQRPDNRPRRKRKRWMKKFKKGTGGTATPQGATGPSDIGPATPGDK